MNQETATIFMVGCFNPITRGHLLLLEKMKEIVEKTCFVKHVVISPTHERYPYKQLESSLHRLEMINLAINEQKINVVVDSDESQFPGGFQPTYKILETLRLKYSADQTYLCYGLDVLNAMCNTVVFPPENIAEMSNLCKVFFFRRECGIGCIQTQTLMNKIANLPHLKLALETGNFRIVDCDVGDQSSSAARAGDLTVCHQDVRAYIICHKLYSFGTSE